MPNRIYTQADYDKVTDMYNAYQANKGSYSAQQQKDIDKKFSDAFATVSNRIEESKNMIADMYTDNNGNVVQVYGDGRQEIVKPATTQQPKTTVKKIATPNPKPEDNKQEQPIVIPEVKQNDTEPPQNTVPPKNTVPPQKDTIVEFPEQNPENNSYLALDETIKNLETDAERISYLKKLGYKPNSKGYYEKGGIKTRVYKDGQYNPIEVRSDNGLYITTPLRNDEVDIALQEQGYNGQKDSNGHFIPKGDGTTIVTSNNNNNKKVNTYNPVGDILNGINAIKTEVPKFVNTIPVRAEGTVQTIKGVNQALEGYNKMTNNSLSTNAIRNALNDGRTVNNRNQLGNETLRILLNQGFTIGTDGTIYRPDGKRFLKLQYPVYL